MRPRLPQAAVQAALVFTTLAGCSSAEHEPATNPEIFAAPGIYEVAELPEQQVFTVETSIGELSITGWAGAVPAEDIIQIIEETDDNDKSTVPYIGLTAVTDDGDELHTDYVYYSEQLEEINVSSQEVDDTSSMPYEPYNALSGHPAMVLSTFSGDLTAGIVLMTPPFVDHFEVELGLAKRTEKYQDVHSMDKITTGTLKDIVLPDLEAPLNRCEQTEVAIITDSEYDPTYEEDFCTEISAFAPWIDEKRLRLVLRQGFKDFAPGALLQPTSEYVKKEHSITLDMGFLPGAENTRDAINSVLTHELAHAVFDQDYDLQHDMQAAWMALYQGIDAASMSMDERDVIVATSALWQIFKDSNYLHGNVERPKLSDAGHPQDKPSELFASTTRILRLDADTFLANYKLLNPAEQKLAGAVITSVLGFYKQISPDADLKGLFPDLDQIRQTTASV